LFIILTINQQNVWWSQNNVLSLCQQKQKGMRGIIRSLVGTFLGIAIAELILKDYQLSAIMGVISSILAILDHSLTIRDYEEKNK